MKHFTELDTHTVTTGSSHYPSRAAANAAAREHVLATGFTATTYSHNQAGHAVRRCTYTRSTQGKVETHRY